jgi:hypothetical protein
MIFICNGKEIDLGFLPVTLTFDEREFTDVFELKNNKSLEETLQHKRYVKFAPRVRMDYAEFLAYPLGKFLGHLKAEGDQFYTEFLNKYGDEVYCRFSIDNSAYADMRGIYAFTLQRRIQYIGRCRDSFRKRINQGYGKIHPKNCYIDGQATNCRLNACIASHKGAVQFAIWPLNDVRQIKSRERELIRKCNPKWNIT